MRKRCHRTHAGRFELDDVRRVRQGPGRSLWAGAARRDGGRRPDYEILLPNDRSTATFSAEVGTPPRQIGTYADLRAITVKRFERHYLLGAPFRSKGGASPTIGQWAADRFWQSSLHGGKKSHLSFPMIGRLAELLLRLNPMARDALAVDLLSPVHGRVPGHDAGPIRPRARRSFWAPTTVVTAVGDNKQQIMRWAMAMDDPFAAFDADFGAKRTPLFNNYRSSPDLVRIQHVLAQALDAQVC